MVSLANQYTDNSNFANVSNPIFGRPRVVQSRTRQSQSRDDAPKDEVEVNLANQYTDKSEFSNRNPLKPNELRETVAKESSPETVNVKDFPYGRSINALSKKTSQITPKFKRSNKEQANEEDASNEVNESPRPLQMYSTNGKPNPLGKGTQFTPFNNRTKVQDITTIGGKRLHDKHKYNSRKKRKNKQKSHKKKYNVKYMSKRHPRRRHSRKRHCSNKQRGGVFGAAQYNETLYGSNAEQQQQHLLNGSLYPSAQGIQTAHTYQGGLRRSGLRRKRGGSLGFIGANVVPATLFATNMIYGNSIKSQRYKKMNNRTYRRR